MTSVEYTDQAVEHLDDLQPDIAERMMDKVDEATEFTESRIDKLSGYPYYKIRAGDYRAILTWNRDEDILIVEAVGHRKNVYERLSHRSTRGVCGLTATRRCRAPAVGPPASKRRGNA